MPTLTPNSKRCLLEQAWKLNYKLPSGSKPQTFQRILLSSKNFVSVGRLYNVYRFCMKSGRPSGRKIVWFEDHKRSKTNEVRLPCHQICALFRLLNPKFFHGHISKRRDFSFIVNMMEYSDCKIALKFDVYGCEADLLALIWSRIVEIDFYDFDSPDFDAFSPRRRFDKFTVRGIDGFDKVKYYLRQNSRELNLHFDEYFYLEDEGDPSDVEVNDGVESCRVFVVGRHDPHEMLSLGRVLVRALTNSLEFRVRRNNSPDEEFEWEYGDMTYVVDDFQVFQDLKRLFAQSSIKSTVVDFTMTFRSDGNEDGSAWFDELKDREAAFSEARIREIFRKSRSYEIFRTYIQLKQNTERISANYGIVHIVTLPLF